jgi:Phage capsid family
MSAVGMTAENVAVPESDPVFSEVVLLPSTLKSFKRGYRISNELVRHSVLAIATAIGQAIVERTALEIDAAMLTGTGTSNTITGFTAMAGTSGVTLGASVVPTIDNLLDAQGSLLAANASLDTAPGSCTPTCSLGYGRSGRARAPAPNMLMNGDAGIAEGTPTGPGTTFRLLGVPVRVSTQVPGAQAGGKIILADMNQVAVGRDTAPSLGVFTETFADSDQLYLRVVARYDIKAPERRRHLHHHHRLMAEQKGAKAPEKTAEGLRRVGVVLYDPDPDQLACIACGQQWQATSLRGHWWRCPKAATGSGGRTVSAATTADLPRNAVYTAAAAR